MCLILGNSEIQKNPAAANKFIRSFFKILMKKKQGYFKWCFKEHIIMILIHLDLFIMPNIIFLSICNEEEATLPFVLTELKAPITP